MKSTYKTSRRSFLRTSLLGTAGLSVYLNSLSANHFLSQGQHSIDKIGLITNTIKNEMQSDYEAALEKIADIGYSFVEGGFKGKSPKKYGKLLDKLGLKSISNGSSMQPMLKSMDSLLKTAEALKQDYIICFWPWLDDPDNLTEKQCLEAAENLNKLGKTCKDAGFNFAWHNHDKEFVNISDEDLVCDILMKNTDPELVNVELDLYWVKKAQQDPIDWFKKYPGRYKLLHVKDMDNTEEQAICCVGDGIIDFASIFAEAETAGVEYYIVENETETGSMKCAEDSFNAIKGLRF